MTKKNWNAKIVGALHSSWVSTKQQMDLIILHMELLEKEASWDLFLIATFVSVTPEKTVIWSWKILILLSDYLSSRSALQECE